MSIPRQDPNFTREDLELSAHKLLEAAYQYWQDCHRFDYKIAGAVQWLEDHETGHLVIFTRGEYRERLMMNIDVLPSQMHRLDLNIPDEPDDEG